jgi:hypothetical protein
MVEYLADGDLLVLLGGNCRGHCPFVFIPFITWVTKKLEKDLPPDHVISHNVGLFQGLTAALNMPQRFSLVAERAIGTVLFAPLVEKSTARKLKAN